MANAVKKTYAALDKTHSFLNKKLFGGELPDAGIILARKKNAEGYFHAERFHDREGRKIDEIAINPDYLLDHDEVYIASVILHEMVHQWQHHQGEKKSRTAYHNKEWADKMIELGLTPSSTNAPGGKMTGQKMGHYINPDGLFMQVMTQLSAEELAEIGSNVIPPKPTDPSKKKVKHTCPKCGQNSWGQRDNLYICGLCMQKHEEIFYMRTDGMMNEPSEETNV